MTFRFLLWLVFFVLSIISAHFKLRLFPHVLILFLALIPLISLLFGLFLKRKIKLEVIAISETIERKQVGLWQLVITNNSKVQPAYCQIKQEGEKTQDLFLNPNEQVTVDLHKLSQHTGLLSVPHYSLKLLDGFRLFKFKLKSPVAKTITVLPLVDKTLFNHSLNYRVVSESKNALVQSSLQSDELDLIRPLQQGDSMKRVHWKVSARLGEWFVRMDETGPEPYVHLIVYPEKKSIDLDHRDEFLDVSASLIQELLLAQVPFEFEGKMYRQLKHLRQARINLALIPYEHSIPLVSQSKSAVTLVLVETLNEQVIFELSKMRNQPIVFVFDKGTESQLANYHHLNITYYETP